MLPALCNAFGVLLLLAVIGLSLPLAAPPLLGYQVFDVVSGSMEPEVPVGSAVFVEERAALEEVGVGDIIAYVQDESVIVHRVTVNRSSLGQFVTKGDANEIEDINPVPYASVVGPVRAHVPLLGGFMAVYSSTVGKVYLLLTAACGVMLNVLASRIRASRRMRADGRCVGGPTAGVGDAGAGNEPAGRRPRPLFRVLRMVAVVVLAVVFLGSAGVVGYVTWQYHESDATYGDAVDRYADGGDSSAADAAPIKIDFAKLCAENPDVVGWIYCEDTPINYPVLKGDDNDQYLHHDYTGAYNINGSIFVDAANKGDFADGNTIVYGHHMNSGSMFASLEKWADQDYYRKHPVMWLLTPTRDYRVELFSGHHVDANSSMYEIIHEPGEQLNALLAQAAKESDFESDVQVDPQGRYVMLSTCAYVFDNARYVLHGKLVPVSSAGGMAGK